MRLTCMNRLDPCYWLAVLTASTLLCTLAPSGNSARAAEVDRIGFNAGKFTVKTVKVGGRTVTFRAYEGIVYVAKPVDARNQSMNVYVPAEYFEGKSVGAYNAETVPILFNNSVGGYMPALPSTLGGGMGGPGGPGGGPGGPGGPGGGPGGPPPGGIFEEADPVDQAEVQADPVDQAEVPVGHLLEASSRNSTATRTVS